MIPDYSPPWGVISEAGLGTAGHRTSHSSTHAACLLSQAASFTLKVLLPQLGWLFLYQLRQSPVSLTIGYIHLDISVEALLQLSLSSRC